MSSRPSTSHLCEPRDRATYRRGVYLRATWVAPSGSTRRARAASSSASSAALVGGGVTIASGFPGVGGDGGNRTHDEGFADLCLTTWLRRPVRVFSLSSGFYPLCYP